VEHTGCIKKTVNGHTVSAEKLHGKRPLEDQGVDGKIILNRLRKTDGRDVNLTALA
jgi:hypothetical protein